MINCPFCGKLTDPKLESCPHCGGYVQGKPRQQDDPRLGPGASRARAQTCPNCHALVKDGDIICVACGTNLLTGQKVGGDRKQPAAARFRGIDREDLMKYVWIGGGAVAALVLLLLGVYVVGMLTSDPVQKALDMVKSGRSLEAKNLLDAYVAKHPEDARAQFELGKLDWSASQFANAGVAFEKAASLAPKNLDAAMLAVLSLASIPNEKTFDQQIQILKRVVQEFPDNAEAQYLLALELGAQNDFQGEIEALRKVVESNQSSGESRIALGMALALRGDYAGAQRELESIGQEGASADLSAALGFAASLNGKPDSALEHLRKAAQGGASVKNDAQARLGMILVSLGRFQEAEPILNEAMGPDKTIPAAQFYRAVCLQARGMTAEAMREFEPLVQLSPPLGIDAAIRVADLYLIQGETQKARDVLDRAEKDGANSAPFFTARGRVLASSSEPDKAHQAFKNAMTLDPDAAAPYLEDGLLYVKQQLFVQGVPQLERYIQMIGANTAGTRVADVQTLVSQLKQASEMEGPLPPEVGKVPPRERGRRKVS